MSDLGFSYRVIRSTRKTIAIGISRGGEVLVRCPNRMTLREVRAFVESRADWVRKQLEKAARQEAAPALSQDELEDLARKAAQYIPQRVAHFAPRVGVRVGRITIRRQRSRWGSCSGKGNLNFNCLLMLAPGEVTDYVVVHELCHRKEMNHSPRFWAEVEKVLPDYKRQKKWLKDHGGALIGRLPERGA